MAIATTCPHCQAIFRLSEDLAGKKVKCQKCQGLFIVPKFDGAAKSPSGAKPAQEQIQAPPPASELPPPPVRPPAEPAEEEKDEREDDERSEPPARKRTGESRRRRSLRKADSGSGMLPIILVLVGVGLLSCFACAVVGGIVFLRKGAPNQPPIAINDPPKDAGMKQDGNVVGAKKNPPVNGINAALAGNGIYRSNNFLAPTDPLNIDGVPFKLYLIQLEAGKTYQIDMTSNQIDCYLYLFDDADQLIFANDDIDPGRILDSRIIFTPPRTATYRIHASRFQDDPRTGNFTLTIRRTAP